MRELHLPHQGLKPAHTLFLAARSLHPVARTAPNGCSSGRHYIWLPLCCSFHAVMFCALPPRSSHPTACGQRSPHGTRPKSRGRANFFVPKVLGDLCGNADRTQMQTMMLFEPKPRGRWADDRDQSLVFCIWPHWNVGFAKGSDLNGTLLSRHPAAPFPDGVRSH